MPQRSTPERRDMLAARAAEQQTRSFGFTPTYRKPVGDTHLGPWNTAGKRVAIAHQPGVPAWMNRHTGKPHENQRRTAGRWLAGLTR